jgi:hypothetical protein
VAVEATQNVHYFSDQVKSHVSRVAVVDTYRFGVVAKSRKKTWPLPESEVSKVYKIADELLKGTQDAEDKERLRACARVVIKRLSGMQVQDKNFSFYGAVHELEARLIEQALEETGGERDEGGKAARSQASDFNRHDEGKAQGASKEEGDAGEEAAEHHQRA